MTKRRPVTPRAPLTDEWGLYDPAKAGMQALYARLGRPVLRASSKSVRQERRRGFRPERPNDGVGLAIEEAMRRAGVLELQPATEEPSAGVPPRASTSTAEPGPAPRERAQRKAAKGRAKADTPQATAPSAHLPAAYVPAAPSPRRPRGPVPLAAWARVIIDAPKREPRRSDTRGFWRGMFRIPTEVALVEYAHGCRIHRLLIETSDVPTHDLL